MTQILIVVGEVELTAEIGGGDTAEALLAALPITARFSTWGDEFYFPVPVMKDAEPSATTDVDVGDIAYWPDGHAVAIFFGRTPMSTGAQPVPASAVTPLGKIVGDATQLKRVAHAGEITLRRLL